MNSRYGASCLVLLIVTVFGCMKASRESARRSVTAADSLAAARGHADEGGAAFNAPAESAPDPTATDGRKIIYEADLTLIVDDFAQTEADVPKLVKQYGGYLADVSVDRNQGYQLSGRWKARIPTDRFDAFLDAVSKLGVPEQRRQTAQDVTEEFVDLEARIANKKRLEERIVELLKESTGKIKDVLEVERELARVRTEIEQMEGRLRYLTNRTALTTVTITAREERDYVPPQAPTFLARIQQAWRGSLLALRSAGESLIVALVFATPWIVLAAVVLVPPLWIIRRHQRALSDTDDAQA